MLPASRRSAAKSRRRMGAGNPILTTLTQSSVPAFLWFSVFADALPPFGAANVSIGTSRSARTQHIRSATSWTGDLIEAYQIRCGGPEGGLMQTTIAGNRFIAEPHSKGAMRIAITG